MPRLQLRMNNPPRRGLGAFMPNYGVTTPAASSQGVLRTEGHIGQRIPSPRPSALNDGELGGPLNQPSACAPDYIIPDLYVARISSDTTMPGYQRTSTNVAPVPAPFIARGNPQTQMKVRIGGRTTTRWPRPFTRWPNYRETGAK